MELWKDIKDYEELYRISNRGNVYSIKRKIFLKGGINSNGYKIVTLCNGITRKSSFVHLLVLKSFNDINNKLQCNHKDGNKLNNFLNNLEWCTPKENILHAHKNNLCNHLKGEKHPFCILNKKQVIEIRKLYKNNFSSYKIANLFKVSRGCISNIIYNKTWKHLL